MMDTPKLRRLLTDGESRTVEFKEQANDTELVEAVVCLANGSGGYLLVGVADSGRVIGSEPRHGTNTDPTRVEALILSRTRPFCRRFGSGRYHRWWRCTRDTCPYASNRGGHQRREVSSTDDRC